MASAKKTISFGIPCYNSAEYMDKCILSILEGSDYADDVQIVIVDDGSAKDNTPAKADECRRACRRRLFQEHRFR